MQNTSKVCELCGAVEPPFWKDAPVNETIRPLLKEYIARPIVFHYILSEALQAWGEDFNPEDYKDV